VLGGALIQGAFVAAVLFTMWCFQPAPDASRRIVSSRVCDNGIGRAAWVGLALGTIGTGLLLYDRTVIQGVNFGGGLAAARNSWMTAGEDRQGVSSPFSVLGYVFGGCHFASAALVILRIDGRPSMRQSFVLLACGALVLASSAMNGGRSSLLLFPAVCLPALCLNPRTSVWRLLLSPQLMLCVVVAIAYSVYIFSSRAALSGVAGRDYTLEFLEYLSIVPSAWIRSSNFPDLVWMSILTWAYLTHSFATTCLIAIEPTAQCMVLGSHPMSMLSKFGLVSPPDDAWFLAGRFPSLPGALNVGFAAARGKLHTWTSDDNIARPHMLDRLVAALDANPAAAIAHADYSVIDAGGRTIGYQKVGPASELLFGNRIGAAFLYRAEVTRALMGYDETLLGV
jgi:hypothetical protein